MKKTGVEEIGCLTAANGSSQTPTVDERRQPFGFRPGSDPKQWSKGVLGGERSDGLSHLPQQDGLPKNEPILRFIAERLRHLEFGWEVTARGNKATVVYRNYPVFVGTEEHPTLADLALLPVELFVLLPARPNRKKRLRETRNRRREVWNRHLF